MARHLGTLMVSVMVLASLQGCATVGEKGFACPGRPAGVRCMSASEVYAATQASDVVPATAPDPLGDDPRASSARGPRATSDRAGEPPRTGQAPDQEAQSTDPRSGMHITAMSPLLPEVAKPMPIRTPARVMRVWIAPWEDTRGRAHGGGNVFIEIETRRWSFGESETTIQPVRFFSIQKTMDLKEPVGKDPRASQVRSGASERSTRPISSTLPNQGASNDPSQPKAGTVRR